MISQQQYEEIVDAALLNLKTNQLKLYQEKLRCFVQVCIVIVETLLSKREYLTSYKKL